MKPISRIFIAGVLVAFIAACNGSTGDLGSIPSAAPTPSVDPSGSDMTPLPIDTPTPAPLQSADPGASSSQAPTPIPSKAETMIVRVYFVLGGEPGSVGLVPVLRVVPKSVAVGKAAMDALLAGPTADESGERTITSAVPDGTTLLGLSIKKSVATVDLSTEFDSGGGTASMQYRLAQVVYTLTQFSTVKTVVFQIEGQTVTVFGSEGIVLDGPVGRADYYDQLPSIFVDRPAYGAAIGNPARVTGNANVFEAQFRMAVLDRAGKTLVDAPVMATCGTGCRGTFSVTLDYAVAKAQWGTLRVYDPSEKDGTPEDIRDYPVWLVPAG